MEQITRNRLHARLEAVLGRARVAVVLGARQVGKTELVRALGVPPENYFDLEKSRDVVRLSGSVFNTLDPLEGTVVIDEAQEMPELFPVLRVLADRKPLPAKFVLTGSVAPEIITEISESLAGRAGLLRMGGFTLEELDVSTAWRDLWLRGAMPTAFLSENEVSFETREDYLGLLVNRDLRVWGGLRLSPAVIWKLLMLIADTSANAWNHSEAGKILGVSYKTVQSYVDILVGAFLVREIPPFEKTTRKRLRKRPKLVIRDSGLMHVLMGIQDQRGLQMHARYGASWETFCIDQIIRMTETRDHHCFSWTIDSGPEVDLVLDRPGGRFGFEFKTTDAPKITKSMRAGISEMGLDRLYVVHPGDIRFPLDGELPVEAVGIEALAELCVEIRDGVALSK